MTCKDCIHGCVCEYTPTDLDGDEVFALCKAGKQRDIDGMEYLCQEFKDKSRFVELPCPIGSEVYVIENCTCGSFYAEVCESNPRTQARKYIKAVKLPAKRNVHCVKLFIRPFKAEYLFKIGKTVFLTREEAEKKLEEMQK